MQNPDLSFIQLKIANIGTALFYCGSNSQLPFSTYIITALKIDQDGYIWFCVNRGMHQQPIDKRPFEAQLEFYRKGCPFFMKIDGEASIADTNEKMTDIMGKGISLPSETLAGIILVKVKIEQVVYTELKEPSTFRPLKSISGWLKHILHPAPVQWQPAPAVS